MSAEEVDHDGQPEPTTSENMLDANSDDVFFVSLSYKGNAYEVPVQGDDHLASILLTLYRRLLTFQEKIANSFPRARC